MEATVMERRHGRCHGSECHGKVTWKWCDMEASWKGDMEVMCHGKRHGKCVMEVSWTRCNGSVVEKVTWK